MRYPEDIGQGCYPHGLCPHSAPRNCEHSKNSHFVRPPVLSMQTGESWGPQGAAALPACIFPSSVPVGAITTCYDLSGDVYLGGQQSQKHLE